MAQMVVRVNQGRTLHWIETSDPSLRFGMTIAGEFDGGGTPGSQRSYRVQFAVAKIICGSKDFSSTILIMSQKYLPENPETGAS